MNTQLSKDFTKVSDNLDKKEQFNIADGSKLVAKVPLSWNNSFSQCVVISHKMRKCGECKKDILCEICDKLVNQEKELSANPYEMKRQPPNNFNHMQPKFITT